MAAVDMPDRVVDLRVDVLGRVGFQLLVVFIHRFGNHIPPQPLGGFGLLIHEIRQRFRGGIGQPFVNRQAIAFGFGNLLAFEI